MISNFKIKIRNREIKNLTMIVSIDVGVKNFGIYVVETDSYKPLFLKNLNFYPYNPKSLADYFNEFFANKSVNIVLLEQQVKKNSVCNRIFHHLEMYFILKFPEVSIIKCSARSKGLDKNVANNYKKRKQLSIDNALKYLTENNHYSFIEIITNATKKDDMCDAICQMVYKYKLMNNTLN